MFKTTKDMFYKQFEFFCKLTGPLWGFVNLVLFSVVEFYMSDLVGMRPGSFRVVLFEKFIIELITVIDLILCFHWDALIELESHYTD